MPIQDKNSSEIRTLLSSLPVLWNTLQRIQLSLSISDSKMAEMLLLTSKDFLRMRAEGREPVVRSAMHLCERLNISFDRLIEGKLDFAALTKHYFGESSYVPERYLSGAFGKRRIAIDYISRVESALGWKNRVQLMRHLQLTEDFCASPDEQVNLELTSEILNWVSSEFSDETLIKDMGVGVIANQVKGPIGIALSSTRNLKELYEMLIGEVLGRYWEKNYLWNVHSVNSNTICVRGIPNPEVFGFVSESSVKNYTMCILRTGIMGAIPMFLGYGATTARKTACVAKGDSFCEFELDVQALNRQKKLMRVV